jgi:hypothetical protein
VPGVETQGFPAEEHCCTALLEAPLAAILHLHRVLLDELKGPVWLYPLHALGDFEDDFCCYGGGCSVQYEGFSLLLASKLA